MIPAVRRSLIAIGLLALASPAAAQWSRIVQVPAANVLSVWANGDTIAAGTDTSVFISTDAGVSWRGSAKVLAGVTLVQAVLVRNGRLYAGTAGQGVFFSDDLGLTWHAFNEGLVGGLFDSQLDVPDLRVRGDSLYAATLGAGVYVRNLAPGGTWSHFGEEFEPNQASNVNSIAVGGTRLLAAAGGNGSVFFRDPGDGEWTISWLDNVGLHPGAEARMALWNGFGWVVGTNVGVFRSVLGQEPWSFTGLGLGSLGNSAFAARGRRLFAAFDIVTGAVIEQSADDGATWQELERLPGVFVFKLAMSGSDLYAGRADGLWRRSTATLSVPGDDAPVALRFALAGAQPAGDQVRFEFELPEPASTSLEVFDAAGRRAAEPLRGSWPAGPHELSLDARALPSGVYQARLTAGGRHGVVRLIHVR